MKTTKSYTQTFVSILLVVLCLFSCNDEGDETKQSIFDRICANTDYSTFKQILIRSGYDKMLSSSGAFTVFAPCNKDLEGENFSDEECEQLAKRYILSEALTIS